MSRFRVLRGYDDGTLDLHEEGGTFRAPLETVLNELLADNEVIVSVQEFRLNSGNAFFTIVVEDIDFRFPTQEEQIDEPEAEEEETD